MSFPMTRPALLLALLCTPALAHEPPGEIFTTRPDPTHAVPLPDGEDVFHFVIYGDRTGGPPEGIEVLKQAVVDTNLLDPDLVMTVGDLVQGYNETPQWLDQAEEFRGVMDGLNMNWFPVAGNHDVYWRGRGKKPEGEHESEYEAHFGPLWYSFKHKNAGFLVCYTDEGNPETGEKTFSKGAAQKMSPAQMKFVGESLGRFKDLDHVFVFLHHPRWIGGGYAGGNWDEVHELLAGAGNVTAVFAGHIHRRRYDGERDGIAYYALAATGGAMPGVYPQIGYLHHLDVVTVRPDDISVATIPVGAVIDPKQYTPERLADFDRLRSLAVKRASDPIRLGEAGEATGTYELEFTNPVSRPIEVTVAPEPAGGWTFSPDHEHVTLGPGETGSAMLRYGTPGIPDDADSWVTPALTLNVDYLDEAARVSMPPRRVELAVTAGPLAETFFADAPDRELRLPGDAALRVESEAVAVPADSPFTLELRANPEPAALKGSVSLAAKTQNSEFALFLNDGVPRFDVHLNGKYVSAIGRVRLEAGREQHVAGVFDGGELRLYVDGTPVGAASTGSSVRTRNALPLYVGADPDGRGEPTRFFTGTIDDVRLSKVARYFDPFEVSTSFEPDADTVLLFPLDRTVGPLVPGRAGVTGRLVGGATLAE